MSAARGAQIAPSSMIAQRFVEARRAGLALGAFPGPIPATMAQAYDCQNIAIDLWGDEIAGWKVGRVADDLHAALGAERLVGPIFKSNVWPARDGQDVQFPVFPGGFAAVEAEFVYRLGRDAPPEKTNWRVDEALDLVDAFHIGIETAGSPLATINDFGATVVATDFGNNNGLILGGPVAGWRDLAPADLVCETFVEGRSVGKRDATSLPGGPSAGLMFALAQCAAMGRPLKAGALVSSGAVTGVHDIKIGQSARVSFGRFGEIKCVAAAAKPMPAIDKGASL